MKFMELLNIYPSTPGKVSESGWHSKIINLKEDVIAEWVFTTICIYKKKDIAGFKFDETFSEYSYLEDLDFSLNLKKKIKRYSSLLKQNLSILKILIEVVSILEKLKF